MMKFRAVKTAIINTLEAGQSGKYVTIGSQKQSKGATEFTSLPRVVVYYQGGDFPRSAATNYGGPVQHDCTFVIELSVAQAARADLSVLNNASSTPEQLQAALAAMQDGSDLADNALDAAFDDVYQVIMAGTAQDFGLTEYTVADRWISNFQKDQPIPRGQFVILTGRCQLSLSVEEQLTGETGTPGTAFDVTVNIEDDQGDNAGASGTLGG